MANKLYNFACDINAGRLVGCKDVIGGIKKVFLMPYDETLVSKLTTSGSNDYLIEEIASITVYQFDLRTNTSSYTSNITSDDANGTTYFEQVLELQLQKIAPLDFPTITNLAQGRVQAFVTDANDNTFLMGTIFGCTVTGGSMQTGTAKADLSGFTITLTAQEEFNYILDKSAGQGTQYYPFDGLDNADNVTVTTGSYPA
jgi:hypothetical protein|tara:strand:+ start:2111 stop:2710 length:600 start_codon:yes stop_codon:yes gene_type:complete